MASVTLIARPEAAAMRQETTGLMERADARALGELYLASYEPGVACDTLEEAIADIELTFDGGYGVLLPEGCRLVRDDSGSPVAAVFTVERAPWPDTPPCPFVIELFTHPDHRRRGHGRSLMADVLHVCRSRGESVALRVDDANAPAVALYRSLGFGEWP